MPTVASSTTAGGSPSTTDIIGDRWVPRALGITLKSRWANNASSSASSRGWSAERAGHSVASAASTTANVNTASATLRALELDKIKRLIDRLVWKSTLLGGSHNLAMSSTASASEATYGGDAPGASVDTRNADDEDIDARPIAMFKLDFYEWYVLLERVLVLLLSFFNISVTRGGTSSSRGLQSSAHASTTSSSTSRAPNGGWAHRYHVNVLEALDKTDNPLHPVLGTDPVRSRLWKAKEYRNKWKGADEAGGFSVQEQRSEILGLCLEDMINGATEGLEAAHCLAIERSNIGTTGSVSPANGATNLDQGDAMEMEMDDAPWEAVDDAMDMDMDVS